ncbi:hypothetical protein BPY_07570 [Bifidobacterium psychraerophilum]
MRPGVDDADQILGAFAFPRAGMEEPCRIADAKNNVSHVPSLRMPVMVLSAPGLSTAPRQTARRDASSIPIAMMRSAIHLM